jgi:hypothetical protein
LQEKEWKSVNAQRMAPGELSLATKQGMLKVYDVSPMHPLLLWEVSALKEAAKQKSLQHLPVSCAGGRGLTAAGLGLGLR